MSSRLPPCCQDLGRATPACKPCTHHFGVVGSPQAWCCSLLRRAHALLLPRPPSSLCLNARMNESALSLHHLQTATQLRQLLGAILPELPKKFISRWHKYLDTLQSSCPWDLTPLFPSPCGICPLVFAPQSPWHHTQSPVLAAPVLLAQVGMQLFTPTLTQKYLCPFHCTHSSPRWESVLPISSQKIFPWEQGLVESREATLGTPNLAQGTLAPLDSS